MTDYDDDKNDDDKKNLESVPADRYLIQYHPSVLTIVTRKVV